VIGFLVGLVAAAISLGRLWLGNPAAPSEVLWAEDGLFPLCIRKADFFTCLTEPFAGYLLFTPRVLALPVSLLPWEWWALATNIIAALLAGGVASFVFVVMKRAGLHLFVSVVVALLPVLAPMSGLEAINSIGSSYMLVLFASTMALVLPQVAQGSRGWTFAIAALLLITALTIPTAVVLVPVVLVQLTRRQIGLSQLALWLAALFVGLAAQAWAALSAVAPRPINFGPETLNSWADTVPVSILTYWPGLSIGEYSFFINFTMRPQAITGWLIIGALVVAGVALLVRGWSPTSAVAAPAGLLLFAGLGFGLIPSAIGDANNRYFVVPLVLWGAAVLLLLEPVMARARVWVVGLVTVVVLIIWWPAMASSEIRSTPAPPWTQEVERVEAACRADPAFVDRPIFSPFWPPNWGDGLIEPTHPNLPCTTVWRWL